MSDIVTLDINAILRQLPHRYPFLLVDRVTECRKGESIVALKNVTYNEPYFPGHFPHRPVMPGVIIIEALAQTAGILAFVTAGGFLLVRFPNGAEGDRLTRVVNLLYVLIVVCVAIGTLTPGPIDLGGIAGAENPIGVPFIDDGAA